MDTYKRNKLVVPFILASLLILYQTEPAKADRVNRGYELSGSIYGGLALHSGPVYTLGTGFNSASSNGTDNTALLGLRFEIERDWYGAGLDYYNFSVADVFTPFGNLKPRLETSANVVGIPIFIKYRTKLLIPYIGFGPAIFLGNAKYSDNSSNISLNTSYAKISFEVPMGAKLTLYRNESVKVDSFLEYKLSLVPAATIPGTNFGDIILNSKTVGHFAGGVAIGF